MISPQEQQRIFSDVARRHLTLTVLSIGGVYLFPVMGDTGGCTGSVQCVFLRGILPSDQQMSFSAPLNNWQLLPWKGGAALTVRFSLGMDPGDVRKLLEAGASALEALPITPGTSAQGETR